MDLEVLCASCKCKNCLKEIIITQESNCKTIKCLQYVKDCSKITKPEKFIYIIKSDKLR